MVWEIFQREIAHSENVTVTFRVGGREADLVFLADPMALGVEGFQALLQDRSKFKRLITPESGFALFSMFPTPRDWQRLFEAWAAAAGFTPEKMHYLELAFSHLEELEVDFMREFHLDIFDWFRGGMSSRRVGNLVQDLSTRPESRFGAAMFKIVNPLSSGELMLAQSVAANSEAKKPHSLLKTFEQRDTEREEWAKIQRMKQRGLSA